MRAIAGSLVRAAARRARALCILLSVLAAPALLVPPLLLWAPQPAYASIDSYEFSSPEKAERYKAMVEELRCPVCMSSNLAGSDSPISADLRREVYRLVEAGKSDDEIREYMYERYGDYILYRPKLSPWSVALYALPVLLLVGGGFVIFRLVRGRQRPADAPAANDTALAQLLARHTDAGPGAAQHGDPAPTSDAKGS